MMLHLFRPTLLACLTATYFTASAQNDQLQGTWQCQSTQTDEFGKVEVSQTITYSPNSLFRSKTDLDFDFFDPRIKDINFVVEGTGDYYQDGNSLCTEFQDLSVDATDPTSNETSTEELQEAAELYRSDILKSEICSAKIIDIEKYRMILETIYGMKVVCTKKVGLS